jgi:DNA-binding XRE family transcriptional regulator
MLDDERYYASFPDENPAKRPTQLVSRVLFKAIEAFERQRQEESEQPLLKVETSDACESAKTSDEGVELRRVLGCWLKGLRQARGLSQRELAEKVGVEYYTIISQLESGLGRIPPGGHVAWAKALAVTPWELVDKLIRCYDPAIYRLLFDKECCKEEAQSL